MIRKLRNCSAHVLTDKDCSFITAFHAEIDGEHIVYYLPNYDDIHAHTLLALVSYKSLVAVYDCDTERLFLLPRWNYSATTQSHIRKFIKAYLNTDVCKYDLEHNRCVGFDVVFCTGYENGTAYIQTY